VETVEGFTQIRFFQLENLSHPSHAAKYLSTIFGFYHVTPLDRESQASEFLLEFIQHVGIPSHLHTDGAKMQTMGEWKKIVKQYHIRTSETEPYSPWQNRAESGIRELKQHTRRIMQRTLTLTCLWDYACVYVARIHNMTINQHPAAHGCTPHEIITGETPDISEYTSFQWYQPVWYLDNASFPASRKELGRWIGVFHRVGQAMCFWILTGNATVISRSSVQAISPDELQTDTIKEQITLFDQTIKGKIGDHINSLDLPLPNKSPLYVLDMGATDEINEAWDHEPDQLEEDDITPQLYDKLLTADVCFTVGEKEMTGKVIGYKRDASGNLIGKTNPNPLLNTRMYQVQFSDGTVQDYAANLIAEAIYSAVDDEGNQFVLMVEILDYRYTADALLPEQAWITSSNRNRHHVKTTKGCQLCVHWKDGSTSWETLANLKNSHPIEVSRFAKDMNILQDPAFAWWAPSVLSHCPPNSECSKSKV
jgi:YD repeat-containing protein